MISANTSPHEHATLEGVNSEDVNRSFLNDEAQACKDKVSSDVVDGETASSRTCSIEDIDGLEVRGGGVTRESSASKVPCQSHNVANISRIDCESIAEKVTESIAFLLVGVVEKTMLVQWRGLEDRLIKQFERPSLDKERQPLTRKSKGPTAANLNTRTSMTENCSPTHRPSVTINKGSLAALRRQSFEERQGLEQAALDELHNKAFKSRGRRTSKGSIFSHKSEKSEKSNTSIRKLEDTIGEQLFKDHRLDRGLSPKASNKDHHVLKEVAPAKESTPSEVSSARGSPSPSGEEHPTFGFSNSGRELQTHGDESERRTEAQSVNQGNIINLEPADCSCTKAVASAIFSSKLDETTPRFSLESVIPAPSMTSGTQEPDALHVERAASANPEGRVDVSEKPEVIRRLGSAGPIAACALNGVSNAAPATANTSNGHSGQRPSLAFAQSRPRSSISIPNLVSSTSLEPGQTSTRTSLVIPENLNGCSRRPSVNMEDLRKSRVQDLVSQLEQRIGSANSETSDDEESQDSQSSESRDSGSDGKYLHSISLNSNLRGHPPNAGQYTLKILGIVPWCDEHDISTSCVPAWCAASRWYQRFIVLLTLGNCIWSVFVTVSSDVLNHSLTENANSVLPSLISDLPLAFGSFTGVILLGTTLGNAHVVGVLKLLYSYSSRVGVFDMWLASSKKDLLLSMGVWFITMLVRSLTMRELDGLNLLSLLRLGIFGVNSAMLLGLGFFIIHICRALTIMVDKFCADVAGDREQIKASGSAREWNVLQAVLRKASSSVEYCIFAMQTMVFSTVLLSVLDAIIIAARFGKHGLSRLVPGNLVAMGMVRVFFCAAAVTDKCTHVPSLINSLGHAMDSTEHDLGRQYLVEYIINSAAGFYVFEVRLSQAMALKFTYVCLLVLFWLITNVMLKSD